MKKLNLIKRLWTDSHEKQSPQRFTRYTAILIMLLTLGVGQMWALDLYLDISAANWPADGATIKVWPGTGSDVTGTSVATNLYKFTVASATGTMYFKRMSGSSTWNQASVSYNSSYNLYKLTGWDAAACSNANVSIATKTHYIYFDNSTTNWSNSYKYFVIGHDYPSAYSKIYGMTAISNTKLWYIAQSYDSWVDATYYAICSPTSSWSGTSWGSSNIKNANKYAAPYKGKYDMNNGSSYLFTPANSSNNCTLTIDYKNDYSALNYSQTVKKYTSTDGGSTYSAASINSGTVTITPYKLTNNGTVSNSSNTGTLDEASETSVSKDAVYTGEVTVTASANTGYTFVGWFTAASGGSAVSTNTSYTYNAPKSTKTIYARFKENRYQIKALTPSPSAGGTSNSPASWTYAGQITGGSISVTANTGYDFSGWTISSGSGTFADASSRSTTFYPTADSELRPNFTAKTITVTLDKNEGDEDGEATVSYNASSLTSISHASRASYSLNGYYTASSGGSKVINADGSLNNVASWVSGGYWCKATNGTLYAQWTYNPTNYEVTYDVHSSGHGTLSAANTSTSAAISSGDEVASGTGVTFTASPSTGYTVDGWFSNEACTSPIAGAGSGTTYSTTITAATSVYVKFKEKTWSVAFAAGTGGSVTTPASTPKTVGQVSGISIAATPATGYTFNTWSSSNGGSFTAGTSTNSNTFKPTANTTVTASFNETKSTITVTTATSSQGTLKFGSTSKSWGATASLGVATTQEITATAAAGFTFVRWDLSGAAASASTLTNATITLKANGSGSTGTATAVFEEDLSSRWHLVGNSSDFPDGWNVNNTTMMQKKTGHSTESVVYFTVNVTSTAQKEFKVVDDNGSGSDIWYGYSNDPAYQRKWTSTTTYTVYSGDENGQNLLYTPTVTGPYEFKVDYSDAANVAVTITYPTSYTLTYSIGSVAGNDGSISTSPTTASGSKVLSGNSVTLTGPAAKTGYTWKGWYTNAAGTEGKIPDTDRAITVTMNADKTLYACYTINNHAITHSASSHGTYTIKVGSAAAVSTNTTSDYGKTITLAATPATGYHFGSWSAYKTGTPATTVTVTSNQFTMPDYAVTVGATFTPNTYRVHFHRNGGAGETVYQNFTYDVAQNLTANSYTRTGYTFAGWALSTGGDVEYANSANVSNLTAENGVDFHLYAKWTPKTTAITLDQTGAASSGSVTTRTGTYNANMPAITGSSSLPTAPQGYAFMGYYDALEPLGTKYYNADGTSAHTWDKEDAAFTLHAYFKQAEITGITFSPGTVVENNSTVNVTAVISPEPTGTTTVCWRILYDNGSALDPQPAFTPASRQGTEVSFIAPNASGMYKAEAVLHLGSGCGGSDISTYEADFQVAGSHNVTVAYKQGSTTIKASTIITGRPLDWSDPITAPEIFGYTFDHWTAGDGITLSADGSTPVGSGESSANPIYITAIYNGTLTANYTQKNIVYFKDNLEWTDPNDADAHIYVNLLTEDYWNASNGSGNKGKSNCNLAMDRVPGTTDIFYYDYGSKPTSHFISFTKESMNNYESFYQGSAAHVVFPSRALDALSTDNADGLGFYAATPMFVPLATQTPVDMNSGHAKYYNDGYWTKFTPGTGYTLEIYNNSTGAFIKSEEFTSADDLMPMKATVDLEGGQKYKFQLKRDGDVFYGNSGTMTYTDHGQNTAWDFYNNSPFKMCTIVTNAAGEYTFNLSYSPNKGGNSNRLRIAVDYPVASGDYRLVYTDNTRSGRIKPSAIVAKENDGTATVSFFVRKDQSPVLRIQQATVALDGTITWKEYPTDGTPTNQITGSIASAITATGVWNFNLEMNGSGAMSVANAEAYTGNYYIRTDAANSKWDNYRTDPDHLMTYSDYLKSDVEYTHYYTHWVDKNTEGRKNVKFVIANDYSPCISDTLIRETASGTWENIASFITTGGDLIRSANVRFMWDEETNNIARAYIDGAQGTGSDIFLRMLSDDGKIKQGETVKTSVAFQDNGNWIYEANVLAKPEAQIKLKSTWGSGTTIEQYFKGSASKTESLVGGSGKDWYPIRVLYDFKTNRLVAAYLPTTGTITSDIPINADVMFIREHHGDIAQLTFTGSGAISKIQTAYGVLRLNKWTINNKSKSAGHTPLSPELSRFERDLFYISFPFRVNLEEVFGFGTYGTHWIIEEYDGAGRAQNGFWKDSPSYWKFITNRKGKFLEPNTGYIVALDLDELGESSSVWTNTDQVELYFPSYGNLSTITSSSVTYKIPAHTCTINRPTPQGDRRIKDSHWNVISVPTYINTSNVTFANTDWTTTGEGKLGPNFLYTWNKNDNTLTATSGKGYTYKAMHAYIVQYYGDITWTTSVTPQLAPRRNQEAPKDVEFRIELQQNESLIDQTFVRLSNEEEVSNEFAFGEDMSKEYHKNKANIYTLIGAEQVAGNCLPMTDQTTIVPMGIITTKAGEYTISIPNGTNGIGVTLVDNETGIRSNLALEDYTVALDEATYENRFYLEISPIKHVATGIEEITGDGSQVTGARKVMVDGILYIIKDGKVFSTQGARVK